MPSNRLTLTCPLAPAERAELDARAAQFGQDHDLGTLADYLCERFGLEMELDPDVVQGYARDESNLPGHADALCRPRTPCECALIVRTCYLAGLPFTVSGGRSNLTGSATPEDGVVVSLAQLDAPGLTIDCEHERVTAPVGVVLEDLRQEVRRASSRRLHFPVNPTSRIDAHLGGALACNASGFTPGAPGAMRYWVEELDIVFPNGYGLHAARGEYISRDGRFVLDHDGRETIWPVPRYPRPAVKNASGPFSDPNGEIDLVDLFIGSEGIFGIVTGCTLRLEPAPAAMLELFFSLPSEERALAVQRYLAEHLPGGLSSLAACEYFGPACRRFMAHADVLFSDAAAVALYVAVPLETDTIDDAAEQWFTMLTGPECDVDEDAIMLIDSPRTREILFEARHSIPSKILEIVQQRGTVTIVTDAVVPSGQFGVYLTRAHALLKDSGLDYTAFGHFGDCHVHFTVLPEKEQMDAAYHVYDELIALAAAMGGVYSGEHGTGKRKRHDFVACYGEQGIHDVARSKAAVDPRCLLCRGNVIAAEDVLACAERL